MADPTFTFLQGATFWAIRSRKLRREAEVGTGYDDLAESVDILNWQRG